VRGRPARDLACDLPRRHVWVMLNLVSILIGLVTLALGLVAFFPLLGWMNWLVIPIGIVGAAVGALSSSNAGRNLNIVLIIIFTLRLMLGGGII
jgi:hypothetical protein